MRLFQGFLLICALSALTACSVPGPGEAPDGVYDPHEAENRNTHDFNKSLDRALVRPVGKGYASVIPPEVQTVVGNFSSNLGTPSSAVNQVLQGDIASASKNTLRFLVNSTIGLAGLVDAATMMGIDENDSDFGETLYVWGAPEGAYIELPLLGPSTERAATGKLVDLFTNPLSYVLPKPEKYYGTAAGVASRLGDRGRYSDTIDSILYESADSYAQSRGLYLQNRRFELGDTQAETYISPDDIDTEGF